MIILEDQIIFSLQISLTLTIKVLTTKKLVSKLVTSINFCPIAYFCSNCCLIGIEIQ